MNINDISIKELVFFISTVGGALFNIKVRSCGIKTFAVSPHYASGDSEVAKLLSTCIFQL